MPFLRTPRRPALALLLSTTLLLAAGPAAAVAQPAEQEDGPPAAPGVLDPGLPGEGLARVVVSGTRGTAEVSRAVQAAGGTVVRDLPLVDAVAAAVPAEQLAGLAAAPGVRAVTVDRTGQVTSQVYEPTLSASTYAWTSGAVSAWPRTRGTGVSVAVLDTGVTPVGDLAGRVVSGPDLSGEQAPTVDSHGHGTVMAGIVAGSGAAAGGAPRTGVAPGATVVSVKVAGADGAADVSTVLAAMTWVAAFRDTYRIRVLNLSWGVRSTQDPAVDPLDQAVERLWALGITVVVAAGNDGPGPGTVLKPGDDPLALTVGAYDDRGDLQPADDLVPAWSAAGPTAQGYAKPDLVAPGRTLVATRSPGSRVERDNPQALVAPGYLKGSGTSEAAAVVSGAAALLLSASPQLTPDQVKAALVRTAVPLPSVPRSVQGAGRVSIATALAASAATVPVQRSATRTAATLPPGTLDGSRGSSPRLQTVCGGAVKVLDDETTAWCAPWTPTAWTSTAWTSTAWTSTAWTSTAWTSTAWTSDAWASTAWTSTAWTSTAWTSTAWTSTAWTSTAWTSTAWTPLPAPTTGTGTLTAWWGDHPAWGQQVPGEQSEPGPDACHRPACAP